MDVISSWDRLEMEKDYAIKTGTLICERYVGAICESISLLGHYTTLTLATFSTFVKIL